MSGAYFGIGTNAPAASSLARRYNASVASATKAFLRGIGFRRPGVLLPAPVSVTRGERTLTVLRLVATPESTDLMYELTHLPNDESPMPMPGRDRGGIDHVWLTDGTEKYGTGGGMSISVREGKLVRTFSLVPIPAGTPRIDLHVDGPSIGEWNVPLELQEFPGPDDPPYIAIGASDTRHGVSVTVRGMVAGANETAFDLIALADTASKHVLGLGGMHMRDASTAITLRDDIGRSFVERFRQDARDQFPDHTGIADVAIFDALPADAQELSIEVPSVCLQDAGGELDIDLPIAAPIDGRLGDHPIRVNSAKQATVTRGGRSVDVIALDVDLGSVDDELCVIHPMMAKADGEMCGIGWGSHGIYAPSPQPTKTVEVYPRGETLPKRITLSGASIRARGPWRVSFPRPR